MKRKKLKLTPNEEVVLQNGLKATVVRLGTRSCLPEEIASAIQHLDKHYLGNVDENIIMWSEDGRRVIYREDSDDCYLSDDDELNIIGVSK